MTVLVLCLNLDKRFLDGTSDIDSADISQFDVPRVVAWTGKLLLLSARLAIAAIAAGFYSLLTVI